MRDIGRSELSGSLSGQIAGRVDFEIGIVVEEADESVFWLEMLVDCDIVPEQRVADLLKEGHELSALFTASQKTARSK